jgi:dTDP-4-amino-4,6-dideoxygalactose transaminase
VVAVSSGSSALHLALEACALPPGSEVLVPAITFVASFQAVCAAGLRPVLCDVRLKDCLIDLEDAARRVGPRTRAIMPVHYAGHAGALGELHRWAEARGLRVVEDAAHAFGTVTEGALIGARGDMVCFSFDPIKNITCGEGGAVVVGSPAEADRLRAMRRLGLRPRPAGGAPGLAEAEVDGPGWRYHLPNFHAAIGRVQLRRFRECLRARRQVLAARYREELSKVPGATLLANGLDDVPHLQALLLPTTALRDAARKRLAVVGYETALQYPPGHYFSRFAEGGPFPGAEEFYRRVLCLPLHSGVDEADARRIAAELAALLG